MLGDATRTLSIEMLLMIRGQSQTSCEQHHAENETYTLCWTQDIFREYVVHLNRLKLTVKKKGKENWTPSLFRLSICDIVGEHIFLRPLSSLDV